MQYSLLKNNITAESILEKILQLPAEFTYLKEYILKQKGFTYSDITTETEAKEYAAYNFKLHNLNIIFRIAKKTPKKVGHFVTLWKRGISGKTKPYNNKDSIDFVIICARKFEKLGYFIFPESALMEHNIFSTEGKEGKRGFRVYPPWELELNKQANKTRNWQCDYFLDFSLENINAHQSIKALFNAITEN